MPFGKRVFLDASGPAPYHPGGPVSSQDKAVYLSVVPLLVVAASYLYVATALAVTLWRERERVTPADLALASIFPAVGIAAAVLGAVVFYDRSTVGEHPWPAFAACLIALVPRARVPVARPRAEERPDRHGARTRSGRRLRATASSTPWPARSLALARTHDPAAAGRALLDEIEGLLRNDFAALRSSGRTAVRHTVSSPARVPTTSTGGRRCGSTCATRPRASPARTSRRRRSSSSTSNRRRS